MNHVTFKLDRRRRLTRDIWELSLLSEDGSGITAPGQFVNLALPGKFLRRPISVCDWTEHRLLLLVKEAGKGTRQLIQMPLNTELDVLTGLGNGFDPAPEATGPHPILAGGGIGIAPLYGLAKRMAEAGRAPAVALGFRGAAGAYYLEEFADLGCRLFLATEDGSLGTKGFVTNLLANRPDCTYVLACGPLPMLKAVCELPHITGGQFSFEARMACGFGACVGCSIPTAAGPRRVCKEGPVFRKEEIVWQT